MIKITNNSLGWGKNTFSIELNDYVIIYKEYYGHANNKGIRNSKLWRKFTTKEYLDEAINQVKKKSKHYYIFKKINEDNLKKVE